MSHDDLKAVRQQGAECKAHNKEHDDNPGEKRFTAHDCPYGPGANRDAWMAGFGAPKEEVEQVDTSEPTTEDVRTETPETVREGAKGKKSDPDATKVSTTLTGTGETSLETHVTSAEDPAAASTAPSGDTQVGDPGGSTAPGAPVEPDVM